MPQTVTDSGPRHAQLAAPGNPRQIWVTTESVSVIDKKTSLPSNSRQRGEFCFNAASARPTLIVIRSSDHYDELI